MGDFNLAIPFCKNFGSTRVTNGGGPGVVIVSLKLF
jgi:hypothetical protein